MADARGDGLLHRLRLQAALSHHEVDRAPIAFGGPACSIHRAAHRRLLDYLGLAATGEAPLIDSILQIVDPDERLYAAFDVDVRWLVSGEGSLVWSRDGTSYRDELGRTFSAGGGFFNQTGCPLSEGTLDELADYSFPEIRPAERAAGLAERGRSLYRAGYGLAADGPWGIYEVSSSLRGPERLFMDMASDQGYVEMLAERVLTEHLMPLYSALLDAVGPYVQLVMVSDDYGSQDKLLFSPRIFRKVYKPRLRRLVEHIRALTHARVYLHSDGAVAGLIPDFIEIGLDGLNPVQYTAAGMDSAGLKDAWGEKLGFLGGGVDSEILAFGTPEAVRREVERQRAILSPGGGYILATIHNIPPEAPPENVVAFFGAAADGRT